jgi:hypothetical protein
MVLHLGFQHNFTFKTVFKASDRDLGTPGAMYRTMPTLYARDRVQPLLYYV